MPFIKYKPFALSQALCYRCGKEILQGDFNWSYHTHKPGMFSHRDCFLTENQFKEQMKNEEKPQVPQPVIDVPPTEPKPIEPNPAQNWTDITDKIKLAGKHFQSGWLKKLFRKRKYPFMYGAPGAGKTHIIISIADDMGLDCIVISCSNDMFKSELLGSTSPLTGNYYATAFRKAWEFGGVILLDEVCLASGAFLNVMNSALAQRELRFPDGRRVKMHEHCFIAFADNAAGYGPTDLFPERNDVGGAFRDRIKYVKFEYDLKLERAIIQSRFNGDATKASLFHEVVKSMRKDLEALALPVFASPRFAYETAEMLNDGTFTFVECCEMMLIAGRNGDVSKLVNPIIERYARTLSAGF